MVDLHINVNKLCFKQDTHTLRKQNFKTIIVEINTLTNKMHELMERERNSFITMNKTMTHHKMNFSMLTECKLQHLN